MSRKRKILVAVSLATTLVVLIPLSLRWKAQWQLNAYRKKLIAAGEKLTVEELAPKRDMRATNTALFLKLAGTLRPVWDFSPSAMRFLRPGVARVAWRQTRCMEKPDEKKPVIDVWPIFLDAMGTNQATLSQLQSLLMTDGIEFLQDYSQLEMTGYSYFPSVKESVIDFRAGAMLALHQERKQDALEHLKSCGTLIQILGKNPLMIDQLVRYACMSIAAGVYWEALQAEGWTDDQLAQLQRQWDQSSVLKAAELSLAMERAREPVLIERIRTSPQDHAEIWNDFLVNSRTGLSKLVTAYSRYWGWRWIWSYQDEKRYLEFMQSMIEATRDAQKGRPVLGLLHNRNEADLAFTSSTAYFDLVGQVRGVTETFLRQALGAQTMANMVTVAIALERYRLAHHSYPNALVNLVPDFVAAVPADCMDGHDLRYRLNSDGTFLLYSVGEDGIDDGGDATPVEGKNLGLVNGRDWVWPRAATDEEVRAYEAEQDKPKSGLKR